MCRAFPGSDYYEGSVTIGLSPRRPSRVPLTLEFGSVTLHSMGIVDSSPAAVVWVNLLGHMVIGLVVGSVIGLVRWAVRPEGIRGHPVGSMLRWSGIVIGLYLLRGFFGIFWSWFWFFDALFD